MGVTNSHWTVVIDIMTQSGNHQRTFDSFCSLFRWHWVAGWKTGVTLGRQPLAKSLSSLYLYKDPPALPILSFPLHHTTQKITEYFWPWNLLVLVQVWSASGVKGSHSYHLSFVTSKSMLKKYFFRWWSSRLTLLLVEDDARAALVPWLLKQSLRFFSAFTSARIKLTELGGIF